MTDRVYFYSDIHKYIQVMNSIGVRAIGLITANLIPILLPPWVHIVIISLFCESYESDPIYALITIPK